MSDEKIQVVMSRSKFVKKNYQFIDITSPTQLDTLSKKGVIYLDDIAKGLNYLYHRDILNWNEIKDTIDADCIDDTFNVNNLEVGFDWNKYKIKWEE